MIPSKSGDYEGLIQFILFSQQSLILAISIYLLLDNPKGLRILCMHPARFWYCSHKFYWFIFRYLHTYVPVFSYYLISSFGGGQRRRLHFNHLISRWDRVFDLSPLSEMWTSILRSSKNSTLIIISSIK